MGVIARQGIKTTIVNFAGALLGMLSVLFIYPLEEHVVGFANNLYSMAFFITPFIGLGVSSIAIKYYPRFKTEKESNVISFLISLLFYVLINLFIFILLSLLVKDKIYNLLKSLNFDASIFSKNEIVIILLTTLLVLISLLTAFSQINGRNAVPSIISNFSYKIFLPVIVLCIYFNILNHAAIDSYIVGFHICAVVVLAFYLKHLGIFNEIQSGFYKVLKHKEEMVAFGFFSGLTSLGSILAFRIDSIMISGFLGYAATGSYVLPMTMSAIMDIPNQALIGVTSPIVAKAWMERDVAKINSIYQKGSMNLMIAGIFILLMGSICFEDLIRLSTNPSVFYGAKWVFITLCFAKLTDMATSINSVIISYSDFYKYNLYFVLVLAFFNVTLNLILIPRFGTLGAAWATFVSIAVFNLIKLLFIYLKFRLNPFTVDTMKLFLFGAYLFLFILFIPNFKYNVILTILIKGLLLSSIYGIFIYRFKFSTDLNNLFNKWYRLITDKVIG